jgi:hypothetical protein
VVTVTEDTDLGEVAALLEAKRIKRVPGMRDGKAVGIISRANLVRALGATKGAPPSEDENDDRTIRARLLAELGCEEWAKVWPEDVIVRDGAANQARRCRRWAARLFKCGWAISFCTEISRCGEKSGYRGDAHKAEATAFSGHLTTARTKPSPTAEP